jgi:hypothetical protein
MPSRKIELELARRHVEQAQMRVIEQTDLVARLREDGHDTASAEALLAVYIAVTNQLSLHLELLERQAEITARKETLLGATTGG